MKIVALAGGVGGAKLVDGLARLLSPDELTVVVNTGDDFNHLGLRICPDLDTVCYTLAGLANPTTGWGRSGETWNALEQLARLGGPTWFRLGDLDLATHLERTRRLKAGDALSRVTRDFCAAWGVRHPVLPMTDQVFETWVLTVEHGWLPFQEYFVRHACEPVVKGFEFRGAESARPAPGVLEAIGAADAVVVCPSNPWVSIDPIFKVEGIKQAIQGCPVRVAVSPIIGGKAVKGPAAKMYAELGIEPSALAVARHYTGRLTGFIFDREDSQYMSDISALGIRAVVLDTLMKTNEDRVNLACKVLDFCALNQTGIRRS